MSLRRHLEAARRKLADLPAGQLEAEILLAHALDSPRSFLYANPDIELPVHRVSSYRKLIQRRARGEPIAYLTGKREFWTLKLKITPDVLIPRHETELLVETALHILPPGGRHRVLDLGTGSGAVALAIASARAHCEIEGVDNSPEAVRLARENAEALGLSRVRIHFGDWFEAASGHYHLMVSNPPYLRSDDPHLGMGDCRFEPRGALVGGEDGLDAIRSIADQAPRWLHSDGVLLMEHGAEQGPAVRGIFQTRGFEGIETLTDLAGLERVTYGRKA